MSGVLIEKVIMLKKVTCLPFGNLISTIFSHQNPNTNLPQASQSFLKLHFINFRTLSNYHTLLLGARGRLNRN